MAADLEDGVVEGPGEDRGCDAPFEGAAGVVGGDVLVANVAAAGLAEETIRGGVSVAVASDGGGERGRRDELGRDIGAEGGVEACEGAVDLAADEAVAEVGCEGEQRHGHRDGEVHRFAEALRREGFGLGSHSAD